MFPPKSTHNLIIDFRLPFDYMESPANPKSYYTCPMHFAVCEPDDKSCQMSELEISPHERFDEYFRRLKQDNLTIDDFKDILDELVKDDYVNSVELYNVWKG